MAQTLKHGGPCLRLLTFRRYDSSRKQSELLADLDRDPKETLFCGSPQR